MIRLRLPPLSAFCLFVGLCGGGTASPPFTPQSLPGLVEWFDAGAGCTGTGGNPCANGGTVATWTDRTGQVTASACAAAPGYWTNVVGGRPALYFTGASSNCLTTPYAGAAGTVIAVYFSTERTGNTASNGGDLVSGDPEAPATVAAYDLFADLGDGSIGASGSYHTELASHGTTANASNYSYFNQTSEKRFVWDMLGMTDTGAVLTTYDFGSPVATAQMPAGSEYAATGQLLGASDSGAGANDYYTGYLAELIIYSGALNATQYAELAAYLENKYALTPRGNSLLFAVNQNHGSYTGNSLHIIEGNGTTWSYELPANYVPTILSGQTSVIDLAPTPLTDDQGDLVLYEGFYWIEDSRCPWANGIAWPCHYIDILSSPDLVNWHLAGTINCDAVLDGVSSTRGCFNDGWFIDPQSGTVNALFNASDNEENSLGNAEYYVPLTLASSGTFAAGTPTAVTGSSFPAEFYTRGFEYYNGTYYTWLTTLVSGGTFQDLYWASSSSPFSGYGAITSTGFNGEWPNWQASAGSGTLYYNPLNPSEPTAAVPATDGAFGTSGGFGVALTLTFPTAGLAVFDPQGAIVAKLPAVTLP